MSLPSYEDFETIKQAFMALTDYSWTAVREVGEDKSGLYLKAEQIRADMDFIAWPPHTVCLSGIARVWSWGSSLVIGYKETFYNDSVANTELIHDYAFACEAGQLTQFSHRIDAHPKVSQPRLDATIIESDQKLDQASQGGRIIRQNTGDLLELTSGDCAVLFDRITDFIL